MVSAKGWTALAAFMRECLRVLGTEIHHSANVPKSASADNVRPVAVARG
jgi:protease I